MNNKNQYEKKNKIQNKIIQKQGKEIDWLKNEVSSLKIDCEKRDEIINSIDTLHDEFIDTVNDLKNQREQYRNLVSELQEMKKVMNGIFFKKKWKWLRWLIR